MCLLIEHGYEQAHAYGQRLQLRVSIESMKEFSKSIVAGLFLQSCAAPEHKREGRECTDYRPSCSFASDSIQKCFTTSEGCYQCECVTRTGEPYRYPEPSSREGSHR